jgi:hypothetical protein
MQVDAPGDLPPGATLVLSADGRRGGGDIVLGAVADGGRLAIPEALPARTGRLLTCVNRTCKALRAPVAVLPDRVSFARVKAPPVDRGLMGAELVGPAGGSVSATAADGSQLVLRVPKGALFVPTYLRVVPVTALPGLTSGATLVAGARLEPEGQIFVRPVSLTITPPRAIRVARRVGFELVGGDEPTGSESLVTVAPQHQAGKGIRIDLTHFSGAGLIQGNGTGVLPRQRRGPSFPPDATLAALEEMIQSIAKSHESDPPRDGGAAERQEVRNAADAFYEQVLRQQVRDGRGLNSEAEGEAFSAELLDWARMRSLGEKLAEGDAGLTEIDDVLAAINEAEWLRRQHACIDNHDLSQFERILKLSRAMALLKTPTHELDDDFACLHYRVDIEARVDYRPSDRLALVSQIRASVPVAPGEAGNPAVAHVGSARWETLDISGKLVDERSECTVSYANPAEIGLDVSVTRLVMGGIAAKDGTLPPPQLNIDVGDLKERFSLQSVDGACNTPPPDTATVPLFAQALSQFAAFELAQRGSAVVGLEPGTRGDPRLYGKQWSGTLPDGVSTVVAQVTVVHTPHAVPEAMNRAVRKRQPPRTRLKIAAAPR